MKTMKRALSLILACMMLFSVMSVAANAESTPYKYVSLGNSTTMGYMLNDYEDAYYRPNFQDNASKYGTTYVFAKWLESQVGELEVSDLCMTGMRSAELRAALDEDYYNMKNETNNFTSSHFSGYTGTSRGYGSYENLHNTFVEAISNADLITYDLCMTDFCSYFAYRIEELLMNGHESELYKNDSFDSIMAEEGNAELAAAAESLRLAVTEIIDKAGLPTELVNGAINGLLYAFASFVINFDKTIDQIYALNDDVQLIVLGPNNIMTDLTLVFNGIELDMEYLWGLINDFITAHIVAQNPHKNQYKFADMSGGIEIGLQDIANGKLTESYEKLYEKYLTDGNLQLGKFIEAAKYQAALSDLEPEVGEAMVLANVAKAAAVKKVDLGVVMKALGDKEYATELLTKAFLNPDPTEEDLGLAHISMRFLVLYATAAHPSVNGYAQKAAAVEKAYLSNQTADGTYIQRAVDTSVSFIGHLFNVLMGKEGAVEAFKALIADIFAPVLKVFKLAGSFGIC